MQNHNICNPEKREITAICFPLIFYYYFCIVCSLTEAHKNAIRGIRKIKYFVARRKFQASKRIVGNPFSAGHNFPRGWGIFVNAVLFLLVQFIAGKSLRENTFKRRLTTARNAWRSWFTPWLLLKRENLQCTSVVGMLHARVFSLHLFSCWTD